MDEKLRELVKEILIDWLEVRINSVDDRLEVSLLLGGEKISSDFIYR